MSTAPERYHPLLVALHWLTALLIFMALIAGFVLKTLPNQPEKILPLGTHMAVGILILVLLVVRFIVRLVTPKPAPATTGNRFLDFVGRRTHELLYLVAALMAVAGIGVSSQAGLIGSVFQRNGQPLPEDFFVFPARYGHGYLAIALIALIALHVGAALYHHFIRRDGLLKRMWFGAGDKRR